ncbi:MAG: type II toxin-antitoxin system RelE/ParE family toxin [Bacteroidia bacterium]
MAAKRKVVLTKTASLQVAEIYNYFLSEGENAEAELFINDFLDVGFDEIPRFPQQFPLCETIKLGAGDYREAIIAEEFVVIFQVFRDRVLIVLVLHEMDMPV